MSQQERVADTRSTSGDSLRRGDTVNNREPSPIQQMLAILSPDHADALMACAIPHELDRDILAWILGTQDDDQGLWDKIVGYAFVQRSGEGAERYHLHERDRQDILAYLRGNKPELFHDYHAHAADYFRWRLGEAITPPAGIVNRRPARPVDHFEEDIWQREAMYHLLAADETAGLARFQLLFRMAKQHYQIAVCNKLLALAKEQMAELSEEGRRKLKEYEGALVFVGRQRELATFQRLLEAGGGLRILYLFGQAGLGKTKLLEEIWESYCGDYDPDLPIHLIDLYEMNHRRVTGVEYRTARLLGESYFGNYFQAFDRYTKLRGGIQPDSLMGWERLNIARERVHQAFITDLQHLPQDRPILLLFDTFEAAHDTDVGHWLLSRVLPALCDHNAVLIFASRPSNPDFAELQERVTTLELKELDRDDTLQYFVERGLGRYLDLIDQVHVLTGGHPILVALIGDLLEKKGIPLQSLLETSEQGPALVLTRAFLETDHDEDRMVSLMALARHRFNDEMLAYLEGIDLQQARAAIDKISDYTSFTKFRPETFTCVLHDIVRDAALRLRWRDPTQRKPLNQRSIAYYNANIEQLQTGDQHTGRVSVGSQIQIFQAERLFYELDLDLITGLKQFKELFNKSMSSFQLGAGELLLRVAQEYRQAFLPNKRLDEVDLMSAELALQQGRHNVADQLAGEILERDGLSTEIEASAWLTRARVAQQQGKFEDAESYCRRSLWLTENKLEFDALAAPAFDILGYVQRTQGEWDRAARYYEQNMRIRERTQDRRGIANTQNNLAYVYLLQGRPRDALRLAKNALAIRQELVNEGLGNRFELGLSYNTQGMIRRNLGDRSEAENDFKRAEMLFEEADSQRGRALVYLNYGLRERHLGHFEQAVEFFQKSAETLRKREDRANLIEVLNEQGMSCLDFGHWEEAEAAFVQALNLAEDTHNHFKIADVLSNMCQLYLFTGDLDKIDVCERRYEKSGGYRFHYPSAQLFIILARKDLLQRRMGGYLWYNLQSGLRLLRYARSRRDVYVSWYRDWRRWRDRMHRLGKQIGEGTSENGAKGERK